MPSTRPAIDGSAGRISSGTMLISAQSKWASEASARDVAGEEARLEVVEHRVVTCRHRRRRIDVAGHRQAGTEMEGGEGEDTGAGADVEHVAVGDGGVLHEPDGEAGRLVAADAEGGARRQAQQAAPGRRHERRLLVRLARIDPEAAPEREGVRALPPGGEPVLVRRLLDPQRARCRRRPSRAADRAAARPAGNQATMRTRPGRRRRSVGELAFPAVHRLAAEHPGGPQLGHDEPASSAGSDQLRRR